jgi:hypothetical protein
MRSLLVICALLVITLGVECANLWREVRADRQQIAGMRAAAQPAGSPAAVDHRAEAMAQAAQQATERTEIWSDRLQKAGNALTAAQREALGAAASTELRREAEEFLALTAPTRESVANLQNETNLRILTDVAAQLTAAQMQILRAQIAAGHAARLAAARAEQG